MNAAELCEARPFLDPRAYTTITVHTGDAFALITRGSPLTEPFLRRAVAAPAEVTL